MNLPQTSVRVVGLGGLMSRPWYQALAGVGAPRASVPFVLDGEMSGAWYKYLAKPGAPNSGVRPLTDARTMSMAWYLFLKKQ